MVFAFRNTVLVVILILELLSGADVRRAPPSVRVFRTMRLIGLVLQTTLLVPAASAPAVRLVLFLRLADGRVAKRVVRLRQKYGLSVARVLHSPLRRLFRVLAEILVKRVIK